MRADSRLSSLTLLSAKLGFLEKKIVARFIFFIFETVDLKL